MSSYCTARDLQEYGFEITEADLYVLTRIRERASRIIDQLCNVTDDYFAAADDAATERIFYGEGLEYLLLDSFVEGSITDVSLPTGYTVPTYRVIGDAIVKTHIDSDASGTDYKLNTTLFTAIGWPKGVQVTVTARWGTNTVPLWVVEATIETALAMWRDRDKANIRVTGLDGQVTSFDPLPPRAKLLVKNYLQQSSQFFA